MIGQNGGTYTVDGRRGRCTCPDHEHRGARCKHLRRVALATGARVHELLLRRRRSAFFAAAVMVGSTSRSMRDSSFSSGVRSLAAVGHGLARGVVVLGVATEVLGEVFTDLLAKLFEALVAQMVFGAVERQSAGMGGPTYSVQYCSPSR